MSLDDAIKWKKFTLKESCRIKRLKHRDMNITYFHSLLKAQ